MITIGRAGTSVRRPCWCFGVGGGAAAATDLGTMLDHRRSSRICLHRWFQLSKAFPNFVLWAKDVNLVRDAEFWVEIEICARPYQLSIEMKLVLGPTPEKRRNSSPAHLWKNADSL